MVYFRHAGTAATDYTVLTAGCTARIIDRYVTDQYLVEMTAAPTGTCNLVYVPTVLTLGSADVFDVAMDLYFTQTVNPADTVSIGVRFNIQTNGDYDYVRVETRSVLCYCIKCFNLCGLLCE